jgi:MoaA/NifB/PqqE/SkfB family radical SAM enzyme
MPSILEKIPSPARRLARWALPESLVDGMRDFVIEGYYAKGRVSQADPFVYMARKHVLRQPPVLHRVIVHLTDHCNLNCKGCSHFSNIAKPAFADFGQFTAEFERMAELFPRITEIFLLGGEPLLHPDLESFIKTTRRLYPESRINLMSNGVLVPRMQESFWETLRDTGTWLLCDLYPVGTPEGAINDLAEKHGVNVEWTDPRQEFFKLPLDLEGKQDASDSFKRCRGLNNCPTLRDGRLYPCAFCAYVDIFEARFGDKGLAPSDEDWISIFDTDDPYEIMDFLLAPVPWCRHCDFDSMSTYEWGRSQRTIDEWLADEPEGTGPA